MNRFSSLLNEKQAAELKSLIQRSDELLEAAEGLIEAIRMPAKDALDRIVRLERIVEKERKERNDSENV